MSAVVGGVGDTAAVATIAPNNTPQASPAVRRRDAQTGGLIFSGPTMRFEKPALSLEAQVAQWQARGLVIGDPAKAQQSLANIGYYRLSAYGVPFEAPVPDGSPRTHQFLPGTTFEQVLGLYVFDRKLRLLVMEALERVEVAVRTRWAHALAMRYGAHAYLDSVLSRTRLGTRRTWKNPG